MKKTELRKLIYGNLREIAGPKGFRLKRDQEAFVKPIAEGQQHISVPIIGYAPEFKFSLVMATRLEAVLDIYHLFSRTDPKYYSYTTTTLTQLEYFTDGQFGEYTVSSEAEAFDALEDLSTIIQDRILPFFDEYCDVPSIEAGVHSQSPIPFNSTQNPPGAMVSVILAHLTNRPDFESLIEHHAAKMAQWDDVVKAPFYHLVDYLRKQRVQNG